MATLEIRNFTRRTPPAFPFALAAKKIAPGWTISLVFAGEARARALNQSLRKKDYTPNVLSYEVGAKSGEIVICPTIAARQAPKYELSYPIFVGFLFIHGLLHLKGKQHGTTMDKQERLWLKRFVPSTQKNGTTHRNRN